MISAGKNKNRQRILSLALGLWSLVFGPWPLFLVPWSLALAPCSLCPCYNHPVNLLPLLLVLRLTTAPPPGDTLTDLCVPRLQLEHPDLSPDLGPGAYAAHVAAARLPDPIPQLPLVPLEKTDPVVSFIYARQITPDAPLFATPDAALAGIVDRTLGKGFIFVNLVNAVQQGNQNLYQIRNGDYIHAADVNEV